MHFLLKSAEVTHRVPKVVVHLRPQKMRENRGQMESSREGKAAGKQEMVEEITE